MLNFKDVLWKQSTFFYCCKKIYPEIFERSRNSIVICYTFPSRISIYEKATFYIEPDMFWTNKL